MNESKIITGDLFLTRSDKFLSKSINAFMYRYAKKHNIPIEKKDIFSHAGIFIKQPGEPLRIAEAVENGFKIRVFDDHYKFHPDYNCVLRPKFLFTDAEIQRLISYTFYLQEINWSYQFWNFGQWILYIILNINTFDEQSKKFLYCYEAAMRIYNHASDYRFYSDNLDMVDYFKLYDLQRMVKLDYGI